MAKQKVPSLKPKVLALQRNTAALFELLGSNNPDDRARFWEILKGITTPAHFLVVDRQFDVMNEQVSQLAQSLKVLERSARTIG